MRYLSAESECDWFGSSCGNNGQLSELNLGFIPSEITSLQDLLELDLDGNLLITGPIPSEIGRLTQLVTLDLDTNDMTGTLPTSLFSLENIVNLDLNSNRFE
eukprot:13361701-Ditylum_brightwellii.AAC.1